MMVVFIYVFICLSIWVMIENILVYGNKSIFVRYSAYKPSSMIVTSSIPSKVSYLDDEGEDKNPPLSTHLPLYDSI